MQKVIIALLFISSLLIFSNAEFSSCDASCGAGAVLNTDCDDGGAGDSGAAGTGYCMTCADGTQKILSTTNTGTYGTCTAANAPCSTNTHAKVLISGIIYYCFAQTKTGDKEACATYSQTVTTHFYASVDAVLSDCLTCQASQHVRLAAATDTIGSCYADTVSCGAPSGSLPGAKIWKSGQTAGSEVFYFCLASGDATAQKKICTTISNSGASYHFDTVDAALSDCTSCASSDQTLVVASATATKGYCVDKTTIGTTDPCDAATKWLATTLMTGGGLEAAGSFCVAVGNTNTGKCAVCTAGTATSSRCAKFKFDTTEYSFASEPANRCAACGTAGDFAFIASATAAFGECLDSATAAATLQAKCSTSGTYLKYTEDANLAHCGSASSGITKCIFCASSASCATVAYFDGPTSAATARNIFLSDDTDPTNRCLTCTASTSFPKATADGDKGGTCTAWATPGCATGEAVLTQSTTLGRCTALTDDSSSPVSKACASVVQTALFANNAAALPNCASCSAGQVLFQAANTNNYGKCLASTGADTRGYCSGTANSFLVQQVAPVGTAVDGRPTNCQSTTVCVYCKASSSCSSFFYASAVTTGTTEATTAFYFATEAAGELNCLKCQASNFVKLVNANDVAGSCLTFANRACGADTNAFIKVADAVGSTSDAFYFCKAPTAASNKQPCATFTYTAPFTDEAAALNACASCASGFMYLSAKTNDYGSCYLTTVDTKGLCSGTSNSFLVQHVAPVGTAVDARPTNCQSTTVCTYCKASSTCASFFYASAVLSTTAEVATGFYFATEAAGELNCLTCQATNYVKLVNNNDKAGSCLSFANRNCGAATNAFIKVANSVSGTSDDFYFCKAPTAATYKQACATFSYSAPFADEAAALNGCATCAGTHVFSTPAGQTAGVAPGSCIARTDINDHCGSGKYMLATGMTDGQCTTPTSATISGDSTASFPCGTYDYPSGTYYYTSDAAAMAVCLTCTSVAYSVVGSTSSATYGKCKDLTNIQDVCGNFKYLKQIGSTAINYCNDATDGISTTLYCKTYFYDSTNQKYASDAVAFTKCLSCSDRKLFVKAVSTDSYGKCYDDSWSPVAACPANSYTKQNAVGTTYIANCVAGADGGATGQKKCKTYFYGEKITFPTTTPVDFTAFNDNCYECDAGQVLLRVPGEKRGKCFDTTANAEAYCGASGMFLKKGTGDADFAGSSGLVFSYCQQAAVPTESYKKQCKTFFYNTALWLDLTPSAANDYCLTCNSGQILLRSLSTNGYGSCISSTEGACLSDYFIQKQADINAQTTGLCTQVTPSSPQVVCDKFYYNSNLYIDDTATNVKNQCIGCAADKLLVVQSTTDVKGICYNNIQAAWTLAGAGNFYKKINHLSPLNSGTSATIVLPQTSNKCSSFNKGYYKDVYEAESDCNACLSGFIKIIGVYKTCQQSSKCSAFSESSFDNLEIAEIKCTACQSGYVLIQAAGATFGVCTPSETCTTFQAASYTAVSEAKCTGCKAGYFLVKADAANAFGTCTASESCSISLTTTSATALTAFEYDCTICKQGYFKVAKADSTANCKAFAASECLYAYYANPTTDVYADEDAAKVKCTFCKAGFFPKSSGADQFGTCTAFTKKTDCLSYASGVATTEDLFLSSKCAKCQSDFFYLDSGNCVRCPAPCRTCNPTQITDIHDSNAFGSCTSCLDGQGDLVLYTNQMFGICRPCNAAAGCATCGAIYLNTAPEATNRKCETCLNNQAYYFAYELELEFGTCTTCSPLLTNCLRCTNLGFCAQCQPGYFQTKNETQQCRACRVTGCAVCVDEGQTCLQFACSNGCKECTSSTVCTQCQTGFYKTSDTCTICPGGCLECSSADTCTKKNPVLAGTGCASNCFECSSTDSSTPAACTTPVWGFYKKTVTTTGDSPVTTVTLEQCISGCKTCSSNLFADCSECRDGYYKNSTGLVCDRCHVSCAQCTGPTLRECNFCAPGFFLQQEFQGLTNGFCQICDPTYCKTCGGRAPHQAVSCTSCFGSKIIDLYFEGFGIMNGKCVDTCPEGKFNDGGFCRMCKLGSPTPCPQPPAVSASYLTFPLILIALIIMML